MHKNEAGSHIVMILVIVAIIGVAGLIAWRVMNANVNTNILTGGNNQSLPSEFAKQYSDGCKERDVSFTSPPLRMQDLNYIRPLGSMLDGHVTPVDHVYVAPTNQQAADNTYPVLMPADGTIVEISRMPDQYIGDRSDVKLAPQDHRVVVAFNCHQFAIFIHVHKLADALAAQASDLQANQGKKVAIDLKAGETFAYIGGSTFDWTQVDTKTTLSGFIHPDLYKGEPWKIHTISPFDIYSGDLKSQLEAKSIRSVAPIGGKIDYDQAGKLVGNWFRSGTNGYVGSDQSRYWDGHLSVVPDYIDPSYTIVSIGNWQGKAAQFVVKGSVNPATVSAGGGIAKYELVQLTYTGGTSSGSGDNFTRGMHPNASGTFAGTIAFEVQSGEKLKVETFPGKTASQVTGFTSAAQTYER